MLEGLKRIVKVYDGSGGPSGVVDGVGQSEFYLALRDLKILIECDPVVSYLLSAGPNGSGEQVYLEDVQDLHNPFERDTIVDLLLDVSPRGGVSRVEYLEGFLTSKYLRFDSKHLDYFIVSKTIVEDGEGNSLTSVKPVKWSVVDKIVGKMLEHDAFTKDLYGSKAGW